MRGYIRQRGKGQGSYLLTVELDKDAVTGKRRQQYITVKGSKKDAEKKLSELLRQLDTGSYIQPSKTSLAEYLTRWLAEYVKPNLSPRGYERYESVCRVHIIPAIGKIPLTQLKSEHLQKLYAAELSRGLAARTVRYIHVITHKALATALKWGLVVRMLPMVLTCRRPAGPKC